MTIHQTATREEWLAARLDLLEAEKELTRKTDELAQRRQQLPWVRIEKDYRFQTDEGEATFGDLFKGRSQLLVYHFMFGPDYESGCPSCSSIADGFNGIIPHLEGHDVAFTAVSLAPLAKLNGFKKRMGWTFPWVSSHGGDFNADYGVSFTETQQRQEGIAYNYRQETPIGPAKPEPVGGEIASRTTPDGPAKFAVATGTDIADYARQRPGVSAFALEDGVVYHTYSTYSRGFDGLWSVYQWLDRTPLGRNETGVWIRRHDEYDSH
jgi:predicted dithiol-disulfide oxidoreductase (DUF899 family)